MRTQFTRREKINKKKEENSQFSIIHQNLYR